MYRRAAVMNRSPSIASALPSTSLNFGCCPRYWAVRTYLKLALLSTEVDVDRHMLSPRFFGNSHHVHISRGMASRLHNYTTYCLQSGESILTFSLRCHPKVSDAKHRSINSVRMRADQEPSHIHASLSLRHSCLILLSLCSNDNDQILLRQVLTGPLHSDRQKIPSLPRQPYRN